MPKQQIFWDTHFDLAYLACHDDYPKGNKHGVYPENSGGATCCVGSKSEKCVCCGFQEAKRRALCPREPATAAIQRVWDSVAVSNVVGDDDAKIGARLHRIGPGVAHSVALSD